MKITKQQLRQIIKEEVDNTKLEKLLIQKKVKIKGWELEVESMSGAWGWYNSKYPDIVVHATLGWDGEEIIPISVTDDHGEGIWNKNFKFKPSGNLMSDLKVYLNTLKKWLPTIEAKLKKM